MCLYGLSGANQPATLHEVEDNYLVKHFRDIICGVRCVQLYTKEISRIKLLVYQKKKKKKRVRIFAGMIWKIQDNKKWYLLARI